VRTVPTPRLIRSRCDTPSMRKDVDVLIVGAGISGIGAAYHLAAHRPETSFTVLDSQAGYGGTWRTHTYPGVRSDSDLYTFGYGFKPWKGKPIASAAQILDYLGEVIDENNLDQRFEYEHRIDSASWSSAARRWTLTGEDTAAGVPFEYTCRFLWMCQGYYRHAEGFQPTWPGMDEFEGQIIHPQTWPDGLDYAGKEMVVIGSGATAATLIPAVADDVGHVTMLQRTPTYLRARPNTDELAELLRELEVPDEWTHEIVRRKMISENAKFADLCFEEPEVAKQQLLEGVRENLKTEHRDLVDTAFTPPYLPWRERVAVVPNGDLFQAINDGQASVVTDHIDHFTSTGIALKSGDHLDADIVVSATGFNLCVLGDIAFLVDGEPLEFHETITYHGAMFTGVPNMVWVFGYFRASWTLRADLLAEFVIRLLDHMDDVSAEAVVPKLRPEDEGMQLGPWIDPENFNPGYLRRGLHLLPQQGDHDPWIHRQDYLRERELIKTWDLDDSALYYS